MEGKTVLEAGMMVQVTLNLPDGLVSQAQVLAGQQARDVSVVLAEALQKLWSWVEVMPEALPEEVLRGLSDAEVLAMAALKLDGGQIDCDCKGDNQTLVFMTDFSYEWQQPISRIIL